jgi:3-oxoacyl-[acyl-carrier-protein] synthase-3
MPACVPSRVVYNSDLTDILSNEEIDKMISSVGINKRHISDDDVLSSDLCLRAAEKLIQDNNIDPKSIDVLLFISQTADYRIPATACTLQHRLGLSTSCAAIDLSLACSGYVYALSIAMAMASSDGIDRVLLLDGETLSKVIGKRDKVNAPHYGDAGTATLIEKGDFGDSYFMLNTDGSGSDVLKIHAGMRNKISAESLIEREREDGNFRSDVQVYMDGMDMFNFAIKRVPRSVKDIAEYAGVSLDDINYFVFHQSNKFLIEFFIKKLKLDGTKVPFSIGKFGNTCSSSVPLAVCSELNNQIHNGDKIVMSGFGAGLSWSTALITFGNCKISDVIEY